MFFTGKGGVGKTSLACATAVALADNGHRVLLASTDPASNLDEVLGVSRASRPTPVPDVPGLSALNINPDVAAHQYRERVVGPYRSLLPASAVARMEEQLSGACTVEIATFDEFTSLFADARTSIDFDHVIFDTAPTGRTLRLLRLPGAWTGFIDTNTTGTSCLDPLAGLQGKVDIYRNGLGALANPEITRVVLVASPEQSALAEAVRTSRELAELGITNQRLIVNGVCATSDPHDTLARALEARGRDALSAMPNALAALPRSVVPLCSFAPMGVCGLRRVFSSGAASAVPVNDQACALPGRLSTLVDGLERAGHGAILTMGKGGVGKTTTAAAIAVDLASRGHEVLLSTTDPAAHVAEAIPGAVPHLRVTCIDPVAETRPYSDEVLTAASSLDARGRDLLEEDLRSPCTEEIAVFRALARTVSQGEYGLVVLDTAPTGQTLLLLDAAEAYHREVSRTQGAVPDAVRQLLPRLRDPDFTKVLLVTVPEATPVHEAAQLQDDLRRAGIEPFAGVINQDFAGAHVSDPILRERGVREQPYVNEVSEQLATRVAWTPWYAEPPVGRVRLLEFVRGLHEAALAAVVPEGAVP
jgi:arsenite-transporting ATPase